MNSLKQLYLVFSTTTHSEISTAAAKVGKVLMLMGEKGETQKEREKGKQRQTKTLMIQQCNE